MQMEMAWRVVVLLAGALAWAMVATEGALDSRCYSQLAPCANYLNNTREDVPSGCCDPLEKVIESEPECICSMISNQGASQAEQAGINLTLAQQLPGRCGIRINPLGCITTPASGPSSDISSGGENWSRISILPWLAAAVIGTCLVDELIEFR